VLTTAPIASALVISPHADDEALGVGGLIAKLCRRGTRVRVLFVAVDGFHHYGLSSPVTIEERKAEISEVARILGFEHDVVYEGKDLIEKLDTVPQRDLVDRFEHELNHFRPDLLLLPFGGDYDQDHAACFRAGVIAARPIPEALGKHLVRHVLTFESPKLAWTERAFRPTAYWDITAELDQKLRAISAYRSQLREPPHVRSLDNVRALAYLRGSEIGTAYAEACEVLRWAPREA
jgi:LmbE family N-acetylglucosaminyl deacetylase